MPNLYRIDIIVSYTNAGIDPAILPYHSSVTPTYAGCDGHCHFIPTSSSWLNQVERFFAALTMHQLRRGAHRSVQAVERAIREYLNHHNEDPKPFGWTKSAEEIIASVEIYVN